ncbi:SGNH/GDSL hydrolase family protein [Novosphingobium sp. B1]|uniref:SGNH/GDSL hydrolase family protein n=1 Tax=Novosphingobium sp. B1 TaxID=1938756 RepID=UPI0009D8D0EB|nr:SGNH/GDSL hydrolase family protein [Novosphingobium sp. B1]SMC32039.1 Lysophospholipase L1 [Novosphingobium sp. B1]
MGQVMRLSLAVGALALSIPAISHADARPAAPVPGERYVAMGSSFAAGPGVGPNKPDTPSRCGRGQFNYPALLAARLKLDLVDATCSGATTEHVLGPWKEIPPQIEAVDASARLVTITIGGNDIAFVGNIMAALCESSAKPDPRCQPWREITEADWAADERNLRAIVQGVRKRAPKARIVFVDYITVLPAKDACPALPITPERLEQSKAVARRLSRLTAHVARAEFAEVFRFSEKSRTHAPCSDKPWSNGMTAPVEDGIPVHPNRIGHEAAAEGLAAFLGKPPASARRR